jgi:4-carboxymuconolactone decarboxylase
MMIEPPDAVTPYEQATLEFVFGQVWSRPGLSRRDRRLVTLSCVAAADATKPIDDHIYAALASGDLTLEEMGEFTLQFAVYCGWPKGSQVDTTIRQQWARLHTERGEVVPPFPMLTNDTLGPTDFEERLRKGEQHFRDLNYVPAPPRDSPYYQAGILNFVFGHVWQRPGMNQRDRRLVTIPCVGLDDAMGPIRSHIGSALKSRDVSFEEMQEIILQFSAYYGFAKGQVMNEVAAEEWARIQEQESAEGR